MAIRSADGSFAGIADATAIVTAAIAETAQGHDDRAAGLMAEVEGDTSPRAEIGRAVIDLTGGKVESAEARIRDLSERTDPARVEAEVNAVGYQLLQAGSAAQAVEVFAVNTRVFPEAFNTWDSLGEGHMALGNDDKAIAAYERSLELNPGNANAEDMIARIREGGE